MCVNVHTQHGSCCYDAAGNNSYAITLIFMEIWIKPNVLTLSCATYLSLTFY